MLIDTFYYICGADTITNLKNHNTMKTEKFYLIVDHAGLINYIYHENKAFRFNGSFMVQRMTTDEIEMLKTRVIPPNLCFVTRIEEISQETANKVILDKVYNDGIDTHLAADHYAPGSNQIVTNVTEDHKTDNSIVTGQKNCANCNNLFIPKNAKGIYCSDKCRVAGHRSKENLKSETV